MTIGGKNIIFGETIIRELRSWMLFVIGEDDDATTYVSSQLFLNFMKELYLTS
jgi:hypothetical protein